MMQKLRSMIKQAYHSLAGNDSSAYPTAQFAYNGKATEVVRLSPYGLCSNPPLGAMGVLFQIQGREGVKYAVTDDMLARYKNLEPGEVQIGNYATKASIKFDNDGNVIVTVTDGNLIANVTGDMTATVSGDVSMTAGGAASITSSGDTTITAPNIRLVGNVVMSGGTVTSDGTNVGSSHVHPGVQSGPSNTGTPT